MTELYINDWFFFFPSREGYRKEGKLGIVGAVSVQGHQAPVSLETLLGDTREPVDFSQRVFPHGPAQTQA